MGAITAIKDLGSDEFTLGVGTIVLLAWTAVKLFSPESLRFRVWIFGALVISSFIVLISILNVKYKKPSDSIDKSASRKVDPSICLRGPYIIFFGQGEISLSEESKKMLNDIVNIHKYCPDTKIWIAAHSDLIHSNEESMNISIDRGNVVYDYLKENSVPSDIVEAKAFGEMLPRVPTKDGVEEQQNRRVEIYFDNRPPF